ncbi:MAG TPA: peptidoglycan DD-metalloendopeptidase family protein [Arenicellales bacterium]|nr:peptidoglycan DD-metalloendopeptidase family protein [Arenicellales bacterium]
MVAPVRDSGYQPPRESKVVRIVRKGDTLYSIAFGAGLDYRAVARWNGIDPPYVIKPGQTLRLRPPPGYQPPVAAARRTPSDAAGSRPESRAGDAPEPAVAGWMWPTRGRIISRFAPDNANPGIDIAGESGQIVRSAADGRVVYSGDGLRGYGKLIIVKHNETFLSAYAHNRKLLVQEGEQVRRGQPIAEMGSTDTDRVRLHFEIRKRGTAVDPLNYLPET